MAELDDKLFEMNQYLKALSKATVEQLGLLKRIAEGSSRSARGTDTSTQKLGGIAKAGIKDTANLQRSSDELKNIGKNTKRSLLVQKSQSRLLSEMKKSLTQQLDMDKRARARGTTLDARLRANSGVVDKLTDGITGFQNAQKVTFSLFDAGFRENNFELARLTTATLLTGQNHQDMIRSMRAIVAGSTITNSEMSHLANVTLSLQERFGVTGEELTSAMAKLKDAMERYDVLGITAQGDEAGKILGAMAGQEFAESGGRLLGQLTSGEGYAKAVMMGVSRERAAFLAGDAQAGVDLVVKAAKFMSQRRDQFLAGGTDPGIMMQAMGMRYGDEGNLAIRIQNQLNRRAGEMGTNVAGLRSIGGATPNQIGTEWTKTADNFVDRISTVFTHPMSFLSRTLPEVFGSDFAVLVGKVVTGLVGVTFGLKGMKFLKGLPSSFKSLERSIDRLSRTMSVGKGRAPLGPMPSSTNLKLAKFTHLPKTQLNAYQQSLNNLGGQGGNLIKGANPIGGLPVPGQGLKMGAKAGGKMLGKKIPFGVGALIGLAFAGQRLMEGDLVGAGLEVGSGLASIAPGAGTAASIGLDAYIMKRDMDKQALLSNPAAGAQPPASPSNPNVMNTTFERMNRTLEEINSSTHQGNSQREEILTNGSTRPTNLKG
jgi:hypothetical protein